MTRSLGRALALKAIGHLYKPYGTEPKCFYCRCPYPEDLDHVPALSRVMQASAREFREMGVPLLLVRACKECNGALNARPLDTLEKRALFLYRRTQKQFSARRLTGEWTPAEILELGPGLRPLIEATAKHKDYLWERLVGLSETICFYDEKGWPKA